MGSPDQVPHFPPNEMSLIRARVCRANLPVCFLIRGLDSFAFAREESALRCLSFPPSRILQGFWVACTRDLVMRPYRYHISLVLDRRVGPSPFHVCLPAYPFRTPDGASYECNAGDWSLLGPLRDPRTHCHL